MMLSSNYQIVMGFWTRTFIRFFEIQFAPSPELLQIPTFGVLWMIKVLN